MKAFFYNQDGRCGLILAQSLEEAQEKSEQPLDFPYDSSSDGMRKVPHLTEGVINNIKVEKGKAVIVEWEPISFF